ncbi:MAG: DUF1622 domain-containing protein [Chloroflexi bacterium]|nr:DUF1622 domain-containing protein [Chloroflexota bacterium]
MEINEVIGAIGLAIDVAGVLVILGAVVLAGIGFARRVAGGVGVDPAIRTLRQSIGKGILLGLELLVAGDIIRTVAIEPTFTSVGVLAIIVAVRTFLSFSLEVELNGRWPWSRDRAVSER